MTDQSRLWLDKPYYSLDAYCKAQLGHKCYKIALDAGMTCPNRDGTLGWGGCIFCSAGGSGDFAVPIRGASVTDQLRKGLELMGDKQVGSHYIAYFQSYTNTYAPPSYLEEIFTQALSHPQVAGISIATRPDCLSPRVLSLLDKLKNIYSPKFIWVELGLQTIHQTTADYIRRGYSLDVFEDAFFRLSALELSVIVHLILGLPGETPAHIYDSILYLNTLYQRRQPGQMPQQARTAEPDQTAEQLLSDIGTCDSHVGVKLQLLHILEGTDLAALYRRGQVPVLEEDAYLELLIHSLELLCPHIVVHRVTGDGPGKLLLAPKWSLRKRHVLNRLHRTMKEQGAFQGRLYSRSKPVS